MKLSPLLAGIVVIAIAQAATGAETGAADTLTKLPLPPAGAPVTLYGDANRIDDVPVCSSKGTMNFYTGKSGTVSAAIDWYSAHLAGFKHIHGFGSGRSQDAFFNATGTQIVSITGEPAPEGQNSKVYSVVYGTIQPGVSEKVIAGMNVQKVVCP